jgi:succinate-semialdehyde dehydrogenase/glutarate-semialdehyde dehydrogenase
MVFVNEKVKSDARLPSGGIKESGFGRECCEYGVENFANIKTVWIQ